MDDRRVRKIPCVRMCWVDAAKRGEELPGFQLQVERQTCRLHKRSFNLDFGLVIVVELENDISEALKVRIDRAIERQFDVARVKTALLRIVIPHFDTIEIARGRVSQRE